MNPADSVKSLKGVGPKKAEILEKLNIRTVGDLISYFPRSYQDRRSTTKISEIEAGAACLIKGRVLRTSVNGFYAGRKRIMKAFVSDDSGMIEVVFFNAAYLANVLKGGTEFFFYGSVRQGRTGMQMINPDFFRTDADERRGIVPVYPLTRGISQNEIRKLTSLCVSESIGVDEFLPADVREKRGLCSRETAIRGIHYPENKKNLLESRYRIAFDEFLMLQLRIQMSKRLRSEGEAVLFDSKCNPWEYTSGFPYKLTGAQKRAIEEIRKDVCSGSVMNRLVQGDVGSGKTAVCEAALFMAVKSGYQGVLMAPTEILARQHFETCGANLETFGIRTACLTGSASAKERRKILSELASGEIDVLIGTHALIQKTVNFLKLGLVVTDEQHRFGVRQRDSLRGKGKNPHVLVMTATPIPRTLAIVLYADMDISVIDEMPPGRKKTDTYSFDSVVRDKAYEFVRQELSKGRQAYVVAPLIEDSETIDAVSAETLFEKLKKEFKEFRVELLHGAMKQEEKDSIMKRFHDGETNLLVSTVVIEVGINVPNATVMVIENCERFGLAQLHQLRGRIGRGKHKSYCILITGNKSEISEKRAEIMVNSDDGFYIAEQDLAIRGPGEISGTRQHGMPDFRMGDLIKHISIMKDASAEAERILTEDPELESVKYSVLKEMVKGEAPVI